MITLALLLVSTPLDTVTLGWLHARAAATDPRHAQDALLARAAAQRTAALHTERRPQLAVRAQATHQSDVTRVSLPGAAVSPPMPPRDRWQALLQVEQSIYDGGSTSGRVALESARLLEQHAGTAVALHALRGEVDAAFFGAWLAQERLAELTAVVTDFDARLVELRARVREGVALPRDTAIVAAERLGVAQSIAALTARRGAALAVLSRLADTMLAETTVLAVPDLRARVEALAGGARDTLRARPEFAALHAAEARLALERSLLAVERRPTLALFADAGVGRPGLNQFERDPAAFWQGGIRMSWRPTAWGATARRADALAIQAEIIATEAQALAARLDRAVAADLALIAHLREGFVDDSALVALREEIERTARAELAEGVITAARYVEVRNDLALARVALRRHRTELAEAEAAFLRTLGIAIPDGLE